MRVLVTFALENECAPWRAARQFREEGFGPERTLVADVAGVQLNVVLTGVGRKRAGAACAQILKQWNDLDVCISAGLAGALAPRYRIGQVVVSRTVTSATSTFEGPGCLQCDADLLRLAVDSGAEPVERFYTAPSVAGTVAEKRALSAKAEIVEMESFDIIAEAQRRGLRAIAIRAVSDGADQDLPLDMNRVFNVDGAVDVAGVLRQVARRPASLPGVMRIARQSKLAAQTLVRFLDGYVLALANQAEIVEARSAV
jgi:adenosylhomocysteine nucleosidase